MERIGEREIWYYIPFTDIPFGVGPFVGLNILTVFNTFLVMFLLWGLLYWATRRRSMVPSKGQAMVEMVMKAFDDLVNSALELPTKAENRKFFPLILSLFVFLILSNFMGFIPSRLFEEPTADINTTLALGIMSMAIAVYCGVKVKGAWGFFEELLGPMWKQEGAKGGAMIAGKLSALFFFPLNFIGEIAKVISISFRIFGNILGGAIIIVVVSSLTYFTLIPIPLDFFFVFFVGTVQAFVFTMLTLTYIAVAIK
jgi:F-type H+-transporting ATPase subunit a